MSLLHKQHYTGLPQEFHCNFHQIYYVLLPFPFVCIVSTALGILSDSGLARLFLFVNTCSLPFWKVWRTSTSRTAGGVLAGGSGIWADRSSILTFTRHPVEEIGYLSHGRGRECRRDMPWFLWYSLITSSNFFRFSSDCIFHFNPFCKSEVQQC